MNKTVRWALVLITGILLWNLPIPLGLKPAAWHLMAIFVATILGFILKPMPMGAMALCSLAITALSGVLKPAEILSGFGNTTIWLIVCAFIFARAFVKTGLGMRIAYVIMKNIGDRTLKLGYVLALSDLIISPTTPSATARAGGIIFPITRSLCSAFNSEPGPSARNIGAYLMQVNFHSPNITSGMFLTAMAGNSLVALLAAKALDIEITWALWASAAIVPGLATLLCMPYIIYKIYPPLIKKTPEAKVLAVNALEKMGPLTKNEKIISAVFLGALILWSTSEITHLNATVVAVSAVVVMIATGALTWTDVLEEKGAWDTMIWMGSIVTLASYLSSLGLINWFAKLVAGSLVGIPWPVTLAALILVFMLSRYGFASATAHITAMFAAFAVVAVTAGAPPYLTTLALGGFAGNLCSSLTHYSGGPAPIVFGAGYIEQGTWWRLGFIMTLVNSLIWFGVGSVWWKCIGLW